MANNNLSVTSMGYNIYASSLDNLPKKHQTIVHTLNQYSFCVAENDPEFKNALQKADVLLPDGIAIVYAVKFVDNKNLKKIAGSDLHLYCLNKLNKEYGSCFYMGSSPSTLQKIEAHVKLDYPNIRVGSYAPPFKSSFSDDENLAILEKVNTFKPTVLFIGMTAPKQEKWATVNKNNLNAQLICSIGAVFDFYAGNINRPNKIWVKLGLEWFIRLIKEPKRIWKRYLYFGPIFLSTIFKLKFSKN